MSGEKEDFDIRLSRRTAEFMGTIWLCGRRQCRRSRRCMATLSPEGEPQCIAVLSATDREAFSDYREIAANNAWVLAAGHPIPIRGDIDKVFIIQAGIALAYHTYAELPANRPLLRQRLRRMSIRWLKRPPRNIKLALSLFGRLPDTEQAPPPAGSAGPAGTD
jgi:hypothetical protein